MAIAVNRVHVLSPFAFDARYFAIARHIQRCDAIGPACRSALPLENCR